VFVTQLCHPDVVMYLLAVKSLARFLPPARVYVLDDTSLTARDRDVLASHVPGLELSSIASVKNTTCPAGGTWERLLFIADLPGSAYAIQLDADTLTLRPPREVRRCVEDGVSFTLGTGQGRAIVPASEAARMVREVATSVDRHVQILAEQKLDELPGAATLRYVRGNSGFAGFGPAAGRRAAIEAFSASMAALLGPAKWAEWGSEQVTSNFVIANSPGAEVLPYPVYGYHHPGRSGAESVLVHYMGTYRFAGGAYLADAREVIRELG
jgi:hypothetical protein